MRADELATTRPDLPPWLKVIWRREHPKGNYTADDPSGGYPLVLREVHEWMLSHQDLKPGTPDSDQFPKSNVDPDAPIVNGEQRVSGLQTSPRSESDIRVNYWDPQKIISASNNISSAGTQAQFYSTDGGATWGQTNLSLASGDAFHSDPTVEWTSNGTAWSSTLGINSAGSVLKLRTYSSANSGATWTLEATPSAAQTAVDKQMHWVDHSASSACKDYQYIIYHNNAPAYITTRNAGTGTWGAPIQVSGAESTGTAIGSDIKSNSAGDAFGFWPTTTNRKVFVTREVWGRGKCGVGSSFVASLRGSGAADAVGLWWNRAVKFQYCGDVRGRAVAGWPVHRGRQAEEILALAQAFQARAGFHFVWCNRLQLDRVTAEANLVHRYQRTQQCVERIAYLCLAVGA